MAWQLCYTRGTCRSVIIFLNIFVHLIAFGGKLVMSHHQSTQIDENITRPEVRIPQGLLQGVNMVTHHGRRIFGFQGIPYAQPPVENLRFKAPLPPNPWNGTLDANRDCSLCPQIRGNEVVGNEDCLYLNVYSPQLPLSENSTLLPVMLHIVGGAFAIGSSGQSEFGPYFLLDKDVILVVPSYRLGVLGFLSTGDEESPGNYGLKDLVRALEWNRENIQYFGGDPNQVTIFGGSSGSTSVDVLTLSNSTNGLFHRYITQSGSALMTGIPAARESYANRATQLGEYLDCPTNTSKELVNCLQGLDASQLVDTVSVFEKWLQFPLGVWRPTVEPDIEGALITDTSANLIAAGKVHDLPWLASLVRDEGLYFRTMFSNNEDLFEEFLNGIDDILPHILSYDIGVKNVTAYTTALKSYYINDLTANRTLLLNNYTQLVGDAFFRYPVYSRVLKQLNHMKSPIYLFSFEYQGTGSNCYYESSGSTANLGVSHGDELLYLFQDRLFLYGPPGYKMNEADLKMVDTMVQLWTSFAINGTPTVDSNTTVDPFSTRKNYLRIGSDTDTSLQVKYNLFEDHLSFWDDLIAATTTPES